MDIKDVDQANAIVSGLDAGEKELLLSALFEDMSLESINEVAETFGWVVGEPALEVEEEDE